MIQYLVNIEDILHDPSTWCINGLGMYLFLVYIYIYIFPCN